jgi:hypothetical protein
MEKIDIKDFTKKFVDGFDFLITKYNFRISEFRESPAKKENSIIHKLIYTNTDTKRIIEFVSIADDYKTHMFSRIAETYVKKILDNNSVPIYNDFENCYKISDLNELVIDKFKYPEIYKDPETYIENVKHIFNHLEKIINSNYWPSINEIGEIQQKRIGFISIAKSIVPYINEIKAELTELTKNGFKIKFDETKIPPYEQSFMEPSICYINEEKKVTIDITFQTRDQEFYVSSNKNKNYFYGRTSKDDYIKLKNKILNKYGI